MGKKGIKQLVNELTVTRGEIFMKTFTRILLLLAGLAMIVLGFWVMFNPVAPCLRLTS